MRQLDIAIAGCGPCGLAAALLLGRAGHRITLFERFEAPRPIGSGLMIQPTGMAVLNQLGLLDKLIAAGSRIDQLFGKAEERVVLDVHYSSLRAPGMFGVGVHRATLFEILHGAVRQAGLTVHTCKTIVGSSVDGDMRRLLFSDGEESAPFHLVVDALGTRTTIAPPTGHDLPYGALWASLDWPTGGHFDLRMLEQRYLRASIMAGVLPIGTPPNAGSPQAAFFWSLRADRLDAWRDAGLDAWKRDVLALWPECAALLDQIQSADQLTFARYAHRTVKEPVGPALIHIGDAWHSASPQLGQGTNMALLDAWALAKGLENSGNLHDGLKLAVALRRRHVRIYQWLTALFTPVYQSDSRVLPFVRDRMVGPLSKLWPATAIQAAMVSGLVGNPLHSIDLANALPAATDDEIEAFC